VQQTQQQQPATVNGDKGGGGEEFMDESNETMSPIVDQVCVHSPVVCRCL